MTHQYFSDDSFDEYIAEARRKIIEEFKIPPPAVSIREEQPKVYDQAALILRMFHVEVIPQTIAHVNRILETLKVVETAQTTMQKATQIQADLEEFRRINNDAK